MKFDRQEILGKIGGVIKFSPLNYARAKLNSNIQKSNYGIKVIQHYAHSISRISICNPVVALPSRVHIATTTLFIYTAHSILFQPHHSNSKHPTIPTFHHQEYSTAEYKFHHQDTRQWNAKTIRCPKSKQCNLLYFPYAQLQHIETSAAIIKHA